MIVVLVTAVGVGSAVVGTLAVVVSGTELGVGAMAPTISVSGRFSAWWLVNASGSCGGGDEAGGWLPIAWAQLGAIIAMSAPNTHACNFFPMRCGSAVMDFSLAHSTEA